jgi:hypothetical protein
MALMGEASHRRKNATRLLSEHPRCIYCGGVNVASTIDHMPPIVIFDQRHRPKGSEFPACEACNSGSRLSDLVVGLMSRLYPNPKTEELGNEIRRLLGAVGNNHPGLLTELMPTEAQRLAFQRGNPRLPQERT